MPQNTAYYLGQQDQLINKRFSPQDTAFEGPPSLELDIENKKLLEFIKDYIKRSKSFYDGDDIKLTKKRKKNKKYLFGKQLDDVVLKSYEKKYIDNVIREGEGILKPLVLSRLPDLIVKPGTDPQNNPRSQKIADNLTTVVDKTLKSREMRKILGRGFKHLPVYYTGVIKYRWDPHKGRNGDVVFEVIHPENIIADYTATENNERSMHIIVHYVEKTIKEWIMLIPNKEQELKDYAAEKGVVNKSSSFESEKVLAANLKIPEVWFDWVQKGKDFDAEKNPKFDFFSGVVWMTDKKILKKSKSPNWDWEGHDEVFLNGQPIPSEEVDRLALTGFNMPGLETKKVFNNFFPRPRKPFIFFGYEQWGEMPYDAISRIENNILMQDNLDGRGMQITKMIDDARGKHVFSTLSGLKKEDVEDMDLANPDEDIVVDGRLRDVHSFIQPQLPSRDMFADFDRTRERMLAKINVHGPIRGEIEVSTATTTQIARESDFTSADDLADETINDVATEIAEALLHMMKLRYTEEHFRVLIGEEGTSTFLRLTNDMIEDGMEVEIFASGTDKLKAEREAKEDAQLNLIDPLTYFKDTGKSDPKGRAEKLFIFETQPELYFKKFVKGEDIPEIAEQVQFANQQNLSEAPMGAPMPGGVQTQPEQPTPTDTTQIPTTPQGSPRNLIGKAIGGIKGLLGR